MSLPSDRSIGFRPAEPNDCSHLVLFADMATRGLTAHLWAQKAAPGQPASQIGRAIIRDDDSHFTHLRNWRVAESERQIVGGLNTYVIPDSARTAQPDTGVLAPIVALKALAVGSFYIASVAVYPEQQGKGYGRPMMAEAERLARAAGRSRMTLLVASHNTHAHRLYRQLGFADIESRPLISFPGSDEGGEWVLMGRELP